MVSLVSYFTKGNPELLRTDGRGNEMAIACVRILQDCPTYQTSGRRVSVQQNLDIKCLTIFQDLLLVLRHIIGSDYRRALAPLAEKIFYEPILLGPATGSQEYNRYIVNVCALSQF